MLNQQLISRQITALRPGQTVEEALLQMEDQEVAHLPLVHNGRLEALIAASDLLAANHSDTLDSLFQYAPITAVAAEQHFLTAVATLADRQLTVVPVVTGQHTYIGCITAPHLLQHLAHIIGANGGGALLVIEMEPHRFSISEISKLIETNDAHITQLNTAVHPETGMLLVTIRINKNEVSAIVATLQRYDYHLVFYSGEEHYENELRQNYQHLMNFLTM